MVRRMPEEGQPDLQELIAKLGALEAEIARKDQIIAALQQRLFGKSSERLDQLDLGFDDATLGKPELLPGTGDTGGAPEGGGGKRKRVRRKKADLFPKNLPVVIGEVIVPTEVAADPEAFKEIGEEHHDELDVAPASMFWRRTTCKKYVSRDDRSAPPLMCPMPEPSLPGTLCAPGLAAQIIADKYCDHLPHYRQSQRLGRQHGIRVGRATLNAWTHAAAAHLAPVGLAIRDELLTAAYIQIDETPIDYLSPKHGETKQGYLWVYHAPGNTTTYYDWQLGRGHSCLTAVIGTGEDGHTTGFRGKVGCDGYSAYDTFGRRYSGVEFGACLAHIRRRFVEARGQSPPAADRILAEIQNLYRIERWLREGGTATPRRARARPVCDRLKELITAEKGRHLPKSKLGEAIGYALGQWAPFERYLDDGEVEIDNNLVENAIRPTKLGAKNYMFFGGAEAGKASALLYTLIENCKNHGLAPEDYLAEVIGRLPADATAEQAAGLTPANIAAERRLAEDAA